MEVYFQLVRDGEGLKKACDDLWDSPVLGFDVETTDLEPQKGELRLIQLSNGDDTKVIDLRAFGTGEALKKNPDIKPLIDLLASKKQLKVAHNAKFDTKWVLYHLGVEVGSVYDTYLASLLISAGDGERRHGLADVVQVFLQRTLDKTEQVSNWAADDLSNSQIEYAAKDAAIMPEVYRKLSERISQDELDAAMSLENDCIVPVAAMEINGVYLDRSRWNEQLTAVKKRQAEFGNELTDLLSAGVAQASLFGRAEINLDSVDQVHSALINLGIPVPDSTRAGELEPLADRYPVIKKLLEYRKEAKSASSFGENILEFIDENTDRIHADFRQIGAPTGRFSCSNPNLQQIPHDTEYRRCFMAPAGKKLVIADYSQIELRIIADLSEDENFIKAFEDGQDFHTATAAQVFGIAAEEVTPEQRSFAKRLNFGVVYGIGAPRFAQMTGVTKLEAERTLQKYFSAYPQLDKWLRTTAEKGLKNGHVRTMSGRMARLRFTDGDRSSMGAAQRYAKNMPVQGTSADILKRALRLLHEALHGTSGRLVNIVHDEIIVECDENESEMIREKLVSSMTTAAHYYLKKVPVKVDSQIADEWSK